MGKKGGSYREIYIPGTLNFEVFAIVLYVYLHHLQFPVTVCVCGVVLTYFLVFTHDQGIASYFHYYFPHQEKGGVAIGTAN